MPYRVTHFRHPPRHARAAQAANSSTMRAQNASRSSGLRLVVMPSEVWTSSSTRVPPAFSMSVASEG